MVATRAYVGAMSTRLARSRSTLDNGRPGSWSVLVSVVLCVLLVPCIFYGLLSDTAYRGLKHETVVGSRAQDVFTLAVLPLLCWSGVRAARSLRAAVLWLGLLFYLAYSYSIYLIGWEQNRVFLLYVVVVTLSAAALLDGLVRIDAAAVSGLLRQVATRPVGWFLVLVGAAFTLLWLTDLVPLLLGGRPAATLGVGGTPYPVYVLDLTVALPVVVASGVMLLRRHPVAVVLAGVVLVKVSTLFLALWLGVVARVLDGEAVPFTADLVPSAVLPVVSITLLVRWARLSSPAQAWWRPTLWSGAGA